MDGSEGFREGMLSITLVLCTVGRERETARCIDSIISQNYQKLEVVVVDQSRGPNIGKHVDRLRAHCPVKHLKSDRIGCSRARNLGASHATGEVIGFPDDDCWYPPGLLTEISNRFYFDPALDGLTGASISEDGSPATGRFNTAACWVQRSNVWTTAIAFALFLRRRVVEKVGGFDEALGTAAQLAIKQAKRQTT